jgi:carboxypeptidase Taq
MKELIGVEPKTNKEGVLQDVHWSWGNLGYFPTYTLGNLNAAQLWKKFIVAHPDWEKEMSSGNFTCYTKWFKEHVWQHGSFFTPDELMKKATGESTNAKYFLEYLEQKFLS